MSKKINRAIAERILEIETQTFDELEMSALRSEYRDYFWNIHTFLDNHIETRDNLVKMDGNVDSIIFFAVRKAYYAGLQDGMKAGDSI